MVREERESLLGGADGGERESSLRHRTYAFLEARTKAGAIFEAISMALIAVNAICFVLSTEEGLEWWTPVFDAVELFTVLVFTAEYSLRFWSVAEEGGKEGLWERMVWAGTDFFSIVDLLSIVPYYVDLFLPQDLPASQFIRLLRIFRVMRAEGRYIEAFTTFDDIFRENKGLLATSGFVGGTTWIVVASFYYLAERENEAMVWCHPGCYNGPDSDDAGSDPSLPACLNRFRSITSSLYYTLLNLFGEFPLINEQSSAGRVIAVFTAVVAVAIFSIPTGIFGAGFEEMISRKKKESSLGPSHLTTGRDEGDKVFPPHYGTLLGGIIGASTLVFGLSTVPSMVPFRLLVGFEFVAVAVLSFDLAVRFILSLPNDRLVTYLTSWYGVVDLFSVLPIFLCLALFGYDDAFGLSLGPLILRTTAVAMRLFKLERYFRSFGVFGSVLRDNSDVLAVSGFAALVMLVFSSTLMYFTEKDNPDPSVAAYYASIPKSMWITLLNLSGESPLCDYTSMGKIVSGFVGLFAVGIFGVSVGLVGAGFEEFIDHVVGDDVQAEVSNAFSSKQMQGGSASSGSLRHTLHNFLEAKTAWGQVFETFITLLIVLTVAQAISSTVESVCPDNICPKSLDYFEAVAVVIFTLEYFCRFYCSPEDPAYASHSFPRLQYLVSFYSIVDILAIFPFYLALVFPLVDEYDDYLRLLRIFRLLKIDKYIPSVSLIDDVFRAKSKGLRVSGFAAGVLWVIFSSLMYLTERRDDTLVDCMTESQRFKSIPAALQYEMILLIGDYPLIDFTALGKLVNVIQIVLAVGVVAVPSGLIASGFTDLLEERRRQAYDRRQAAATLLQRIVRGHLARKKFREAVEGIMALQKERERLVKLRNDALSPLERYQKAVFHFVGGRSLAGNAYRGFIAILILVNCMSVILESEPDLPVYAFGMPLQSYFDAFEAISVTIFTLDYMLRIFAAPVDGHYGSIRAYVASFYGMVDLFSVIPWYLEVFFSSLGVAFDASTFRVLRLFRLLQLDQFLHAFSLLKDVWASAKPLLAATGLLALIVWIVLATLFFLFERSNACTGDAFRDIPSAMYYVAIFLGGEWGQIDFSPAGKVLSIFTCVIGIAVFALPVGTLFEAYSEALSLDRSKEEDDPQGAKDDGHEKKKKTDSKSGLTSNPQVTMYYTL